MHWQDASHWQLFHNPALRQSITLHTERDQILRCAHGEAPHSSVESPTQPEQTVAHQTCIVPCLQLVASAAASQNQAYSAEIKNIFFTYIDYFSSTADTRPPCLSCIDKCMHVIMPSIFSHVRFMRQPVLNPNTRLSPYMSYDLPRTDVKHSPTAQQV